MSTVYIIQASGERFDFQPAERFGELSFVLDSRDSVFRLDDTLLKLSQRLSGFTKDDYLLPIGNPVLIRIATALVSDMTGGRFHMLQWLGREREYLSVPVVLWNGD